MIPISSTLQPDETEAVLVAALQDLQGTGTRLERWTADDRFTEHGKRKVVRYDLEARLPGSHRVQRFRWLGKFYDSDEDARRVMAVLRDLATNGSSGREGLAVPNVITYHAPRRLLLMTYESGESVGTAIARDAQAILAALGRALATLHALPVTPPRVTSPGVLLDDLRSRVEDLCKRFPAAAGVLRNEFLRLEQEAPPLPAVASFVHGDFGPANLLWRSGHIVALDFDKCAQGDPALDLGNLLTQLLRMTVRKPEKLHDFPSARAIVLDAYQSSSPKDPGLDGRVAWYERAILLRKIHKLLFSDSQNRNPEVRRKRAAEATQLVDLISAGPSHRTPDRFPTARIEPVTGTGFLRESERARPVMVRPEGFPFAPRFPQLALASDPKIMLEVFRTHLKPVGGRVYRIEDCVPFRFRCHPSAKRCVLQYTLHVTEPSTGRRWDQWVTGLLYADEGKAERHWKQMESTDHPGREIPEGWITFEPVVLVPEMQMLVEVFPFDRRLRNLSLVMGGARRSLEPPLLARLGPGAWQVEERTIEPIRYRTELGAALRYTIRARDARTGRVETTRCFLKVYNHEHGAETLQLLRSLSKAPDDGQRPYSVIKPIDYLSEFRTLALEEAPGHPLSQLLLQGMDPADAMRPVAQAIAAFNQDDLPIPRQESRSDHLEVVRRASSLVQWACPETGATVQSITDAVVQGLDEVPPGPIHGDLKPDHIFLSEDRVIFIDLDRAALGDPVRDPAHLVAYLLGRLGLDAMPRELTRAAAAAFVEEYFRRVPSSWRERFPLHCAGALIELASGFFSRHESGWRDQVAEAVEAAHHALSDGFW
ncbi:MAG TPA: aminoglycoside phosphotransferase family protein [Thermoplasmata archaeon]